MFAPHFTLARHIHARHVAHLDRAAIADVMALSYRVVRSPAAMDVTLSRDLLLFTPKGTSGRNP
jgi:hypothetical protein